MKFDKLTDSQLTMIKDPSLTVAELSKLWGFGTATIQRWRRTLGVNLGRGSKRGKPRPWQIKQEERSCLCCGTEFIVNPSDTKKYCSQSCGSKNIDKSYMQTEEYRRSLRKDTTPEYKRYCNRVHKLSKKIYEQFKHEINPNNYPRGLAGEQGVYHLDHIVSIRYGFDNNLLPEEVARKENLQMLPWRENISKGK
jgi:hypothetical protein